MHRNFHVPAGTSARIAVDLRVEDLGAGDYTLSGAVYDEQHRSVPMAVQEAGESEDGLPAVVVPQMPVGLWQYELRAGGRPLLHGHLHVLPSPLSGEEGRCNWVVSVDPAAEVARISVGWQPEAIDYGRVGELADAAVMARLYEDRPTSVAEKEWSDSVLGFEAVSLVVRLDGRAYALGMHVSEVKGVNMDYVEGETPLYVQLERTNREPIVSQQGLLLGDASACPEGVAPRSGWTYWTLPGDARLRGGDAYWLRVFYIDSQGNRVKVHFKLDRAQGESVAVELYALCSAPVYPAANTLLEEACARAEADAAAAAAAADRAEEVLAHTQGVAGEDGQSAYDIWLAAGHTGTQDDFLASLKGDAPTAEQMQEAASMLIYDEVPTQSQTPAGTENATCNFIELDAQHVPAGRLQSISLRSRNGGNPAVGSYMAVWELGVDGETWSYLGSSTNAPEQTMNTTKAWEFADGIVLSGRTLRILAQPEPTDEWETSRQLGVRTSTPQAGDATKVYNNGTGFAYLPEISIAVQQQVAKFAPASHVEDATVHVSADERTKWNSTDANLTTHKNNATIHITSSERTKWNNAATNAAANAFTDEQKTYLTKLATNTDLDEKTGILAVEDDVFRHANDTTVHLNSTEHTFLTNMRSGTQAITVPSLTVNGTNGNQLLVMRGNASNVTVTGSSMTFNVPKFWVTGDYPALYSYNTSTGVTKTWFAVTQDAASLAPLGLTEPGVYAGDASMPLYLRGSELCWNGEVLDLSALASLGTTLNRVETDLTAHTNDTVAHVTADDRARWDASGGSSYGVPMAQCEWTITAGSFVVNIVGNGRIDVPFSALRGNDYKVQVKFAPSQVEAYSQSLLEAHLIYPENNDDFLSVTGNDTMTIRGLTALPLPPIISCAKAFCARNPSSSSGSNVVRIEGYLIINVINDLT